MGGKVEHGNEKKMAAADRYAFAAGKDGLRCGPTVKCQINNL